MTSWSEAGCLVTAPITQGRICMSRSRDILPAPTTPHLSRRAALRGGGSAGLALAVSAPVLTARAAQDATPVAESPLPESILTVMDQPRYAAYTQWGIYVADRETGE